MSKKVKAIPAQKKGAKAQVKVSQKMWSDRFIHDQIPEYIGEELPKRNS